MSRPYACISFAWLCAGLLAVSTARAAGGPADTAILPPAAPWNGASVGLIAEPDDPWITPAERSGLQRTPDYRETVAWLKGLAAASPQVSLVSLGRSLEGRTIWLVVASAGGERTPLALQRAGKPILMMQAGIHSGEIDGKDAGMMLLRDMTVGGSKQELLDGAAFLFVPILNVDGHENRSPRGRINQRGPEEMGWRTNGRNLNLNRDWSKIDTAELQALIPALERWRPDLLFDIHVTDGLDYQYDFTWGYMGRHGHSPSIAGWLEEQLDPALQRDLTGAGHVPGPLIWPRNFRDYSAGLLQWSSATPRYSDGYGALRHLPTVLVENHSLKPYPRRVLGTYVAMESAMRTLARGGAALRKAIDEDRARRPSIVPLAFQVPEDATPRTILVQGVEARNEPSSISGGTRVTWTGRPIEVEAEMHVADEVSASVTRPAAYWIPADWPEAIERLDRHGVAMERARAPRTLEVEMYRMQDPRFATAPYEGRMRVTATPRVERIEMTFPAGSVRVPTDQPLGDLAVLLLEPEAPDSLFQWGFFLEIFQRTEYVEGYVMEPMAEKMLAADPELAEAFREAIASDPVLADSPRARLQWLYRRTPFADPRYLLYPVARETAAP